MHPCVHCSIIYNSQDTEVTLVFNDRWMDKENVYIYNGVLPSHKKEWDLAIYNNMDGPRRYNAKWN